MSPYVYDMIGTRNYNLKSGTNYGISDITKLPTAFTDDFTAASLTDGVGQTFSAKELPNAAKFGIQIITSAVGAGLSAISAQLQCSNVGGTAAECWSNVGTATACGAAVGSDFVTLPVDMDAARHAKFYRLILTATGGTATCYAVAYGYNES